MTAPTTATQGGEWCSSMRREEFSKAFGPPPVVPATACGCCPGSAPALPIASVEVLDQAARCASASTWLRSRRTAPKAPGRRTNRSPGRSSARPRRDPAVRPSPGHHRPVPALLRRPCGPARTLTALLLAAALLLACVGSAPAQQAPLTQLQFDIVGVRLVVDPPGADGAQEHRDADQHVARAARGRRSVGAGRAGAAHARARWWRRNSAGRRSRRRSSACSPGQPIPLPAFALPGDYFLDGIRLVKDGVPLLDAQTQDGRSATTDPDPGDRRHPGRRA